jgi:hypothetical protein
MKRYACKYTMSFDTNNGEGWLQKDVDTSQSGLSDAFLLFSILHEEDGSSNILILPRDDENKKQELNGQDLFNCWMALTKKITESHDCSYNHRLITSYALATARNFLKHMSERKLEDHDDRK